MQGKKSKKNLVMLHKVILPKGNLLKTTYLSNQKAKTVEARISNRQIIILLLLIVIWPS